ncbi:MAG TPA: succinylglutamate desuccinylase/aspartoacylase family protein [Ramlibacter sp.]|uniref:succinylglutamate desuccinylase/aspartoacylase domain-containing protein n=1 Tax=Ramlibacter sp. TaxID=1917967 RepID=UPI002B989492|nr:succinylglutamate desuccinylase/aspartoacylase family protein [Ramlibacter sp.]HVZ42604.1 succinylglutamate desuccinylase/aspartoacylase family protein [Ramlibacter sp.]
MNTIVASEGTALELPDVDELAAGNSGTRGVWRFESGQPGPHAVISALMHGNEVCGAVALAPLLREPPRLACGALTLVFCNLDAYAKLEDRNKADCRLLDEDMNRVWGRLDGDRGESGETRELRRARELLPIFESADCLLDLHSMTLPGPALGLVGQAKKTIGFAHELGYPALLVRDAGHEAGRRLIDRPRFVDESAPQLAMLIECGEHFSHASCSVAAEAVRRVIEVHLRRQSVKPVAPQELLEVTGRVTIASPAFRFVKAWGNMELVPQAGTLIAFDGEREVHTPHADAYMVMPSTPRQIKVGTTAVRFARRVA